MISKSNLELIPKKTCDQYLKALKCILIIKRNSQTKLGKS